MARGRGRSSVALWAALLVAGALVVLELLLRRFGQGETVTGVLCDLVAQYTPWTLSGWACLLLPAGLVLLVGLLIDGLAGNRR